MKIFIAAAALAVALPSMAFAQATGGHAGHGEHHGTAHGAGHGAAAKHGEDKPCCPPGKDGKMAACCEKARKEGKKMPCCDHQQHKAAGHGAGHGEGHGAHGGHAGDKAD